MPPRKKKQMATKQANKSRATLDAELAAKLKNANPEAKEDSSDDDTSEGGSEDAGPEDADAGPDSPPRKKAKTAPQTGGLYRLKVPTEAGFFMGCLKSFNRN